MRGLLAFLLPLVLVLAGACGGDDDDADAPSPDDGASAGTTEPEAEPAAPLAILVTDDDGVEGPGMDALVAALVELPDTEVVVVAPAEDQSGTGDDVSPSPPAATETTLASGHEAIAVAGFPADAVVHALSTVYTGDPPDLVVSGINAGQNLGPIANDLSGTVGAARTAARAGVPALAVSQGIGDAFDFATGVELALDWIEEHRQALLDGEVATDTVANLNVPSCTAGEIRGLLEVETATDLGGRDFLAPVDCSVAAPATEPTDDIDAFNAGYAPLADVPVGEPPA